MFPRLTKLLLVAVALVLPLRVHADDNRLWTRADGGKFRGEMLHSDGETVSIALETGAVSKIPVGRLSLADREWIVAQLGLPTPAQGSPAPEPSPAPAVPQDSPKDATSSKEAKTNGTAVLAGADFTEAEIVSEEVATQAFKYRTKHFAFESNAKLSVPLVKEISRLFEATHQLLSSLPWHLSPKPPPGKDRFRVVLLEMREQYYAAGGPMNSAGVYRHNDRTVYLPFESLGLKRQAKEYTYDRRTKPQTLIHELTHQLMGAYMECLPIWVAEGTAEYTSALPYRDGKFYPQEAAIGFSNHMRYLDTQVAGGRPDMVPLEQLFAITPQQWEKYSLNPQAQSRLYYSAHLAIFYLMHLHAKGDGSALNRYFEEISGLGQKSQSLEKEMVAYEAAMAQFMKLPGVEDLGNGKIRYPDHLTPPRAPEGAVEWLDGGQRHAANDKPLNKLLGPMSVGEMTVDLRKAYDRLGLRL